MNLETYRQQFEDEYRWLNPPPLHALGPDDRAILSRFTQWLLDERGLAPATVKLYLVAVRRWMRWLEVNDLLPTGFPLAKALLALDDALAGSTFKVDRRPPEPPEGIERVLRYYESPHYAAKLHARLVEKPGLAERLSLEMLRNRALLACLGETGGRVSEVLSLRVGDFPPHAFEAGDVWRVTVHGKGDQGYYLRFLHTLPYLRVYLTRRPDAAPGDALFIAHSKRYEGQALSRQVAWKIVSEAAAALGLGRIHPHDFRHYRATQLVEVGEPLDVVQEYLGHRSVEVTRQYYAHTREARVDEAARRAGLLE
ncbi:MAG: tyrosine-type recombinase/integrase [Anaerolineae bacterium]|nr:tyrosine-type recombinase/integrase [Anaerolineae bacterium]